MISVVQTRSFSRLMSAIPIGIFAGKRLCRLTIGMGSKKAKRHVQGDGRPFSMPHQPSMVVRHSEISSVLQKFSLKAGLPEILSSKLIPILGRYLGKLADDRGKLDHARSLTTLSQISAASDKLAKQLSGLKNDYLVAIEDHRGTIGSDMATRFEMHRLVPCLQRLARASADARTSMEPAPRHRLVNQTRQDVIRDILNVFDSDSLHHAKLEVVPVNPSGQKRIDGLGGQIIVALFEHFDPHFDVPAIWGVTAPMIKQRNSAALAKGVPLQK